MYGRKSMKPRKSAEVKAPKGTHRMADGTLMTGEKHTKDSKPVKKGKAKSGAKGGTGKGSAAMKEKMAKLRAKKGKKK